MTMNLASDSVAPCTWYRLSTGISPSQNRALALLVARPHVDEAHSRRANAAASTRLDDLLFGLATTLLLVAVALPLPASLSLLA